MDKSKSLLVFAIFYFLLPVLSYAQVDTAWVRRYNGPGNYDDYAYAIAVDDSGNVYVAGRSYASTTNYDYATIKYNSSGVQQWVQRYSGPGNNWDEAIAIAVDGAGNVYVTGWSYSTTTNYDYATVKYNSAGVEQWVQRYNGAGNGMDRANAMVLDGQGNVHVTGYSQGAGIDFNYATIKYNSSGVLQWIAGYDGTANSDDHAYAITVDDSGYVYVTGGSRNSGTWIDYTTVKYDADGGSIWIRSYNGPGNNEDRAHAIAVDGLGNVYVTGRSMMGMYHDYATIKYNRDGDTVWVRRYSGPGNYQDEALALALDGQGNVYVTGWSEATGTYDDIATIKYDSAGVEQWVQRYNGPGNSNDRPSAIAVDSFGNIYITGYSVTSGNNYDYVTIKYNSAGVEQWVQRYNGPGNNLDEATAIAVDNSGNVYVTGFSRSSGSSDSEDYATIKYVQTAGINELMGSGNGELRVSVYPNPARTFFTIHLPSAERTEIKIFDVMGKMVKEFESFGVGELRVPLDGIKNGIYFIKVDDMICREKLIVTK
ncbi:MAG: SBBP repeat-containing protein [Candidatus Latescibacteria bacterium]|nr:SBBP repeat-containing protein [Candidatus Latescibacterota bacterium]